MNKKPINIKINYNNGTQNFISLPARFGSITTNGFIYANSLKRVYKLANKYATDLSNRLNVNAEPTHLIQCLEIGIKAFLLKQWGYVSEMEMSKEFVVFYNIAAFAFLNKEEFAEQEIVFNSDSEFIKLVA